MKLIAAKDFNWAHRGVEVENFQKGAVIETEDPDLIKVATDEGWAKKAGKAVAHADPASKAPAAPGNDPGGASDDTASAPPPVVPEPAGDVQTSAQSTDAP